MNSDSTEFEHLSGAFICFGIHLRRALKIWDYFQLINTPPASQNGVHEEATVLLRNQSSERIFFTVKMVLMFRFSGEILPP